MPATLQDTDIRIMRGSTKATKGWVPHPGEPMVDLETMTMGVGDGYTLGGIPLNSMTSLILSEEKDLNTLITYGRFFLADGCNNGPDGITNTDIVSIEILAPEVGASTVWQKLSVFTGMFRNQIFSRNTLDGGTTWSDWINTSSLDFSGVGSGTFVGDNNVNHYSLTSQAYVENIINGPTGTNGCDAFLFTYRKDKDSPYIYQWIYLTKCSSHAGKIYYRYSNTANVNWNSPGYNWRELDVTRYLDHSFSNVSGILNPTSGGTGRNTIPTGIINLASNASGSVIPPSGNTTLGVTGVLGVANGGTGSSSGVGVALSANNFNTLINPGKYFIQAVATTTGVPIAAVAGWWVSVSIFGTGSTTKILQEANKHEDTSDTLYRTSNDNGATWTAWKHPYAVYKA